MPFDLSNVAKELAHNNSILWAQIGEIAFTNTYKNFIGMLAAENIKRIIRMLLIEN